MTDIDIDAIEGRAKAATPGKWFEYGEPEVNYPLTVHAAYGDDWHGPIWDNSANIYYIVAVQPRVALALIAALREARQRIAELERERGEPQDQPTWLRIGQIVEKYTGDYQLLGEVRAVFTNRAGKVRCVVEHTPGFLHIYNEGQLRRAVAPSQHREKTIAEQDRAREIATSVVQKWTHGSWPNEQYYNPLIDGLAQALRTYGNQRREEGRSAGIQESLNAVLGRQCDNCRAELLKVLRALLDQPQENPK